jgi:hypothetical protein
MTMTDNHLLSYNKIKRFDTYFREGNRKGKTSKCNITLKSGSAAIYTSDQIEIDDDMTLRCCDRICIECCNDHSFQPHLEGVRTSNDAIPKILPGLFYKAGEIH